jgi:hypothetical protein
MADNTQQSEDTNKDPAQPVVAAPAASADELRDYNFPTFGKTVQATSIEEANVKMQELLKSESSKK